MGVKSVLGDPGVMGRIGVRDSVLEIRCYVRAKKKPPLRAASYRGSRLAATRGSTVLDGAWVDFLTLLNLLVWERELHRWLGAKAI
jgi:hypothetical protein